jgi:hypothetical protein
MGIVPNYTSLQEVDTAGEGNPRGTAGVTDWRFHHLPAYGMYQVLDSEDHMGTGIVVQDDVPYEHVRMLSVAGDLESRKVLVSQ